MNKIIILIITIYLFIYCFITKQDYINVSQVIKNQILSIIKKKQNRRKSDIYNFLNIYIIPLFLAICVSFEKIIQKNFYDNIIVILAILVSVFLTLISILTSKSYINVTDKQKTIINLTFNNVYFLTSISILLLILCFLKNSIGVFNVVLFDDLTILKSIFTIENIKTVFDSIVIYLIIEIIVHLLIVLKRIQQIFFVTFKDNNQ